MVSKVRAEVKPMTAALYTDDDPSDDQERAVSFKERIMRKKAVLSDNALIVLEKRYLRKDESGAVIETPEELFFRVAADWQILVDSSYVPDSCSDDPVIISQV